MEDDNSEGAHVHSFSPCELEPSHGFWVQGSESHWEFPWIEDLSSDSSRSICHRAEEGKNRRLSNSYIGVKRRCHAVHNVEPRVHMTLHMKWMSNTILSFASGSKISLSGLIALKRGLKMGMEFPLQAAPLYSLELKKFVFWSSLINCLASSQIWLMANLFRCF